MYPLFRTESCFVLFQAAAFRFCFCLWIINLLQFWNKTITQRSRRFSIWQSLRFPCSDCLSITVWTCESIINLLKYQMIFWFIIVQVTFSNKTILIKSLKTFYILSIYIFIFYLVIFYILFLACYIKNMVFFTFTKKGIFLNLLYSGVIVKRSLWLLYSQQFW